ncbi:MAG: 50S ribosomal protein L23 [Elusimicrobia bacterium]|nr:50S ribosomal protein L23 [Elusimicrobiota bacterium]
MPLNSAVLVRPILTEKSTALKEDTHQYLFEVDPKASKGEIAEVVQELFKVRVLAVRTLKIKGKVRRMGRFAGRRPDWKKAIVAIPKDQKIDFEKI